MYIQEKCNILFKLINNRFSEYTQQSNGKLGNRVAANNSVLLRYGMALMAVNSK